MINSHRIKIFASIILSFILVQGIMVFSENPEKITVQVDNIKGILSDLKFKPAEITKLFTLNIGGINNGTDTQKNIGGNNSFQLPSISNYPTPTNIVEENIFPPTSGPTSAVQPSLIQPTTRPTATPVIRLPTNTPRPTNTPQPTKTPKPTSTPKPAPITSDLRPGKTLDEIFNEVQKRECVPAALLLAFKTKETGERFKTGNIQIYNTYGWWKTSNPCYGFAYYTQSGIIPQDSMNAGTTCSNPLGNQSYDQKIMGILQISEQEQTAAFKYQKEIFPNNYDRRVMFDNAMIFARITKLRLGTPPKDCVNWSDSEVKLAAAKHSGGGSDTCEYYYSQSGVSGNYCTEILQLYKQYK